MSVKTRNNVTVSGDGERSILFAHGYGCDQNMWRLLTPEFEHRYRVITFDLVGAGQSDLAAYDRAKYGDLQGYADDVIEIVREFATGPVIFIGHSVSATIGLLACNAQPDLFSAQVMVGPSPRYINEGDYVGGFTEADIEDLINTLESNYLGWASTMAPAIMGAPEQPALSMELTNSFCRTDPEIAKHFARVTFLSDHREDLYKSTVPALILQCTDDLIAPVSVGHFMTNAMPNSTMELVDNVGHCPHLSSPDASTSAIRRFLAARDL